MNKMIANKKGDVPISILVIGVFAICTFAILSFILSSNMQRNDSLEIELFEGIDSDVEKFCFFREIYPDNNVAVDRVNDLILLDENKFTLEKGIGLLKISRGPKEFDPTRYADLREAQTDLGFIFGGETEFDLSIEYTVDPNKICDFN